MSDEVSTAPTVYKNHAARDLIQSYIVFHNELQKIDYHEQGPAVYNFCVFSK
jgi:alpha-N-acetylglucosamine transferase